ncbi:hypothetical protein HMPREF9141_1660 [Prevotella multiformis DSM 16608]|uniref:Uncharacterized protein n=1 Tax=Prevotella multiformis DSM 16608 TaxID=888743 RepID=F0F7U3_9BACT|nr:hypothetical protein HMPREF9141_1660 [Prevotella multiformis DSM 16608]
MVSRDDRSVPTIRRPITAYVPNDTTREETFFYHGDHLVSMSYITDNHAYNG